MRYYDDDDFDPYDDLDSYNDFVDPFGKSALRVGPRIHPCPTCGEPNRLSDADVRYGYQCDVCADRAEKG